MIRFEIGGSPEALAMPKYVFIGRRGTSIEVLLEGLPMTPGSPFTCAPCEADGKGEITEWLNYGDSQRLLECRMGETELI
jgi:hypothetical protein